MIETSTRLSGFVVLKLGLGQEFQEFWPADSKRSEKKPADVHYSYVFIVLFFVLVCSDVSLCHGSFLDQRKNQLMFIIRMFLSCFFSCYFLFIYVSLVLFGPEKKPCQGEVLGAYEQMLEQLRPHGWDLMEMIRCWCVQRWVPSGND